MNRDRIVGLILLVYFLVLAIIRFFENIPHNVLWVSHAALLMAGIGLFMQSHLLLSSSLVLIFVPHSLWIFDLFMLLIGVGSLKISDYLLRINTLDLVMTLHHFILLPLLTIIIWIKGKIHKHAWIVSTAYVAFLNIIIIAFTPYNINCAREVCDTNFLGFLYFLNDWPQILYFIAQLAILAFIYYLTNIVLAYLVDSRSS